MIRDDDDIPIPDDLIVPVTMAGEKRGPFTVSTAEEIDSFIDSLRANAAAQDYPPPEEPRRRNHERYRPSHPYRAAYTDQRSLTHDAHLDERPVPGYADFPKHIAQILNFREPTMPSKSPKQARLMAAAAHNPSFAKKVGVPQKVAREFNQADSKSGILKAKRPGK